MLQDEESQHDACVPFPKRLNCEAVDRCILLQSDQEDKGRVRAVEGIMDDFHKMQEQADQRFREWEDEQCTREMEIEEKR